MSDAPQGAEGAGSDQDPVPSADPFSSVAPEGSVDDAEAQLLDDLSALGCDTPVLPGVMPLANPTTIKRFADMAGSRFPEELAARVEAAEGEDRHRIVVDAVARLSQQLLDGGATGLHLYCLNRSAVVLDVVEQLGSWR